MWAPFRRSFLAKKDHGVRAIEGTGGCEGEWEDPSDTQEGPIPGRGFMARSPPLLDHTAARASFEGREGGFCIAGFSAGTFCSFCFSMRVSLLAVS
jgi:hypothetical protein